MKRIILLLLSIFTAIAADAQVNLKIGTGAYIVASGTANLVMDTGSMMNNGAYIDSTGLFTASGGIDFSGSGTTRLNNFNVNNAQHTTISALVSVYNTANLIAGNLDANNNLYIRSDANNTANMVVSGTLTGNVKGIIAKASITSGACPSYTSALSLNISGPVMQYQWQSSPDSAIWSNISGATLSTYTPTVTATTFYRCNLSTTNTAYAEATPGVKLQLNITDPILGITRTCHGVISFLSDATSGGTWSSSNSAIASVSSGSGIVFGVSAGTATITYIAPSGCVATSTFTVNALEPVTGTNVVCQGSTTSFSDAIAGGVWSSANTAIATVSSSGIVTGVSGGVVNIMYSLPDGCSSVPSVTVNPLANAGVITGPSSVIVGANITLTDLSGSGIWSATNSNATVLGGIVTGVAAGSVTISYAVTNSCGTVAATKVITVNGTALTGINGNTTLCAGGTTTLTDATTGGTWSMSSLVATIAGSTGLVTASSAYSGTARVTYTVGTASVSVLITVNPNPAPIQGATSECAGATIILTDVTTGGAWTGAGDVMVTGIGSTGTVSANSIGGTATVTYTLPTGCVAFATNTVYAIPLPIVGAFNVCVGGVTTLTDASSGANWSSSNTIVAVASGPSITGESTGTAVITFTSNTAGYCYVTQVITVSPQPAAITGNTAAICPGTTLSLTDGPGVWSSGSSTIATVGSTGIVAGLSGGTTSITYLASGSSGCVAKTTVTVNATASITGTANVCPSGTTALHNAIAGGTWSSGATMIATVSAGGVVTGLVPGTANISYTTTSGCVSMLVVTVSGLSTAISGNLSLCQGMSTTLSDATSGGTWSMSSIIASIVGSTGVVTASASQTGTASISYAVGGCSVTGTVTVNAKPMPIQGTTAECVGVTIALTDATSGGTWGGSGDATVAGTGSTATLIAGAVGGTATVIYTLATGCYVTTTNTIYAKPQPIMGNFNMCAGLVTILSDASPVSSWSSSNTAVAIASGADISGEGAGTATITFRTSATGNCITTQVVTVSAMPVVTPINGPASISHVGSPISISDATSGGIWTSSNTSVITLSGSTGSPVGATALSITGNSVITYAVTISGCTTKVTKTVSAAASPHPDGGNTTTISAGSGVSLADDIASGTWSSSDNGIATVDGIGMVTGITQGNVTITHETTGDDGRVSASVTNVTVTALPALISVLPNPNKGTFAVRGSLGSVRDEEVTLEVTDMLGQVIYRTKVIAVAGKLNETITLSNTLANGMYILNARSGTEDKTFHFVKEQ